MKYELIKKYTYWINSIAFYDSVIVIRKSKTPKTKANDRIVVGKKQPIHPTVDESKAAGYYFESTSDK